MSNILNSVTDKLSGSNKSTDASSGNKPSGKGSSGAGDKEPTFSILPYPNPNDPKLPGEKELHGGLKAGAGGAAAAFDAPGPYIPSQEIRDSLPQPLSREELQARQASLNLNAGQRQ